MSFKSLYGNLMNLLSTCHRAALLLVFSVKLFLPCEAYPERVWVEILNMSSLQATLG